MDHMLVLLLIFLGNSIMFSIVGVPIYIASNSTQGFPFLHNPDQHLLIVVFLIIAILTGVRYLTVLLTCVGLMISDVEHLFI